LTCCSSARDSTRPLSSDNRALGSCTSTPSRSSSSATGSAVAEEALNGSSVRRSGPPSRSSTSPKREMRRHLGAHARQVRRERLGNPLRLAHSGSPPPASRCVPRRQTAPGWPPVVRHIARPRHRDHRARVAGRTGRSETTGRETSVQCAVSRTASVLLRCSNARLPNPRRR